MPGATATVRAREAARGATRARDVSPRAVLVVMCVGYFLVLLASFLLWGIGIGVLTPAVVSAAIAAVPNERAGLASAINNTSRQAGGAIGIAIAGAVAGQPSDGGAFVSGFHTVAIGAACVYALAALAGLRFVPGELVPGRSRSGRRRR